MLLGIIYVVVISLWAFGYYFGRDAISCDYEYTWRCVDESDLGTVVIRLLDDGDRLVWVP